MPVLLILAGLLAEADEGGQQERELALRYRASAERLRFKYPYVGALIDQIAEFYGGQARGFDCQTKITKRLRP